MIHKLVKTDNYLFVVVYDSNRKKGHHYYDTFERIIAHLPLNGAPIIEGVLLLPE
jgi:hypothetical protein